MSLFLPLRAVVQRLGSTPSSELPATVGALASSISNCRDAFQKSGTDSAEINVLINKLKARITTLFRDRSADQYKAKFSAVVLTKATIEAGGWEILNGCEAWVKELLDLVKRPGPSYIKKLSLITLTRIFTLTRQYPTLVRQVTTPSLPTFVTLCLNIINEQAKTVTLSSSESHLSLTALQCLAELMPHHPTVFRPFAAKIRPALVEILSTDQTTMNSTLLDAARKVFVCLAHTAPQNSYSEEWLKIVKAATSSIHTSTSRLFRAVLEDWESTDPNLNNPVHEKDWGRPPRITQADDLGLNSWEDYRAGSIRIATLLKLITQCVTTPTKSAVSVPVGSLLDLTSRLTYVTMSLGKDSNIRYNPEAGREEREKLRAVLPNIHCAALELLDAIVSTLGIRAASIASTVFEQLVPVFRAESYDQQVRQTSYKVLSCVFGLVGPTLTKSEVKSTASVVKYACRDLLPVDTRSSAAEGANATSKGKSATSQKPQNAANTNADSFLTSQAKTSQALIETDLTRAAWSLLPLVYTLPSSYIPVSLRAELDRTAILLSHKDAMLASVLNPAPAVGKVAPASLAPFLARLHPGDAAVESFLRPRLPAIVTSTTRIVDEEDEDEDGDAVDTQDDAMAIDEKVERPASTLFSFSGPSSTSAVSNTQTQLDAQLPATSQVEGTQAKFEEAIAATAKRPLPTAAEEQPEKKVRTEIDADITMSAASVVPASIDEVSTSAAPAVTPAATSSTFTNTVGSFATAQEDDAADDSDDSEIPEVVLGDDTDDEDE